MQERTCQAELDKQLHETKGSEGMKDRVWVLMAMVGESWDPVAVFSSKKDAETARKVLNYRLYGTPTGSPSLFSDDGFSIREVILDPHVEDTGTMRYVIADTDGRYYPVAADRFAGIPPEDLMVDAMSYENKTMWFDGDDCELREWNEDE